MVDNDRTYSPGLDRAEAQAKVDAGLRKYMLQVYNYMTSGLVLTAITAMLLTQTSLGQIFYNYQDGVFAGLNILGWIAVFAPLAVVWFGGMAAMRSENPAVAQGVFWGVTVLFGVSMAPLVYAYTGADIARAFFVTAGTFAAMSLWGYTTKKDLSGWGTYLLMAVFGLIIASLVHFAFAMFFGGSEIVHLLISVAAVIIFTLMTAYDTQQIRNSYYGLSHGGEAMMTKFAVLGALNLYINFIVLFQHILHLIGNRE